MTTTALQPTRRRATRPDDLLDRRWPSDLDRIALAACRRQEARPAHPHGETPGTLRSRLWQLILLALVTVTVVAAVTLVALATGGGGPLN